MIKLSKRLKAIASLIRNDAKVLDVGCDHAHLGIYLKKLYPSIKVIAIDNKTGSLAKAKINVNLYQMNKTIDLRFSDGLSNIEKTEVDTIIIAGMGAPNIVDILTKDIDKLDGVNDLIIQANNDDYYLRKSICKMGYYIIDEKIIKERGIYYIIIHFKRGCKRYNHDDYLFGPILRKGVNYLYKEFITYELKKKEILLLQIPQKHFLSRLKVRNYILKLVKEIK